MKVTETKTDMQCERRRGKDSSGQICTGRETVKTNTAPFCLPHQKAFSSKCQGSWISGLPLLQSQARLPSRFYLLPSSLDCQVSYATGCMHRWLFMVNI